MGEVVGSLVSFMKQMAAPVSPDAGDGNGFI
jgi:hypothetical protein